MIDDRDPLAEYASLDLAPTVADRLSARIEAIVDQALDHAQEILRAGTPRAKVDFMRTTLPVLVRCLRTEQADTSIEQLRANQERIFRLLIDDEPDDDDMVPRPSVPDIPTDEAGPGLHVIT